MPFSNNQNVTLSCLMTGSAILSFLSLKFPFFKKELPCLHDGGCPLLVGPSWVVEFPFSFVSRSSFYRHGTVPLVVGIPYLLSANLKPDEYFRRYQLERMAANEPDRKHFTKGGSYPRSQNKRKPVPEREREICNQ